MKAILAAKSRKGMYHHPLRRPPGCTGHAEMLSPTSALMGLGYTKVVLSRTDDSRGHPGTPVSACGTGSGDWRTHCSHQDGDRIAVDLFTKKIDILVDAAILQQRKKMLNTRKRN